MFDNTSDATWEQFHRGIDIILDLHISDDLKARSIAHMLLILVDADSNL